MEDIIQLKRVVMESFEAKGILSEIRAQIRASVFKAVEESNQGPKKMNFEWEKENPLCIPQKDSRSIMTILIVDLFHHLDLQYSANVLKHETNIHLSKCDLEKLREIGVDIDKVDQPYMYQVLRQMKQEGEEADLGVREKGLRIREDEEVVLQAEKSQDAFCEQSSVKKENQKDEQLKNEINDNVKISESKEKEKIKINLEERKHQNQQKNQIYENTEETAERENPQTFQRDTRETENNTESNEAFVQHLKDSEKRKNEERDSQNEATNQVRQEEPEPFREDGGRMSDEEEEYEDPNDLYLREPEVFDMTADSKFLKEFEFDETFEIDS